MFSSLVRRFSYKHETWTRPYSKVRGPVLMFPPYVCRKHIHNVHIDMWSFYFSQTRDVFQNVIWLQLSTCRLNIVTMALIQYHWPTFHSPQQKSYTNMVKSRLGCTAEFSRLAIVSIVIYCCITHMVTFSVLSRGRGSNNEWNNKIRSKLKRNKGPDWKETMSVSSNIINWQPRAGKTTRLMRAENKPQNSSTDRGTCHNAKSHTIQTPALLTLLSRYCTTFLQISL